MLKAICIIFLTTICANIVFAQNDCQSSFSVSETSLNSERVINLNFKGIAKYSFTLIEGFGNSKQIISQEKNTTERELRFSQLSKHTYYQLIVRVPNETRFICSNKVFEFQPLLK